MSLVVTQDFLNARAKKALALRCFSASYGISISFFYRNPLRACALLLVLVLSERVDQKSKGSLSPSQVQPALSHRFQLGSGLSGPLLDTAHSMAR